MRESTKQLFRPSRGIHFTLVLAEVILIAAGFYLAYSGHKSAMYFLCVPTGLIMAYLFAMIAVDEDDMARKLWPEVAANKDAQKIIARAKKKSKSTI